MRKEMLKALGACACLAAAASSCSGRDAAFTDSFGVDKADLASVGTNRFFLLAPGYTQVFEGREGGKPAMLTITVLNETKIIDGVETRVVEEREVVKGQVAEVSRNYFAISRRTSDVFYFGEDVDNYKDGRIADHGGSWHSGVDGAKFGLVMPGTPLLGARYMQEIAPGVAMDRAEVVSLTETFSGPVGTLTGCLKTAETSALESGREYKLYAPGVGLVEDGDLKLIKSSP